MEQFKPKTANELEKQVRGVESTLGDELPMPSSRKESFDTPLDQLKEQFPRRYAMYIKTLRSEWNEKLATPEEKADMKVWLKMLNNLDLYIELHKSSENGQTLRKKQFTVFEDMREHFEQGERDGYVKLPTGVGKTVLFAEFVEALDSKTLIVVPTIQLVDQTVKKLKQFAPGLEVGMVFGGAKEFGKNVTVTTYNSLVSQIESGNIKPEDFQCLILDEAHRGLSETRVEVIDKFSKAIRLGFTATPKFSSEKEVAKLLNTEIHNLEIKEAIHEGMLSPVSVIIAKTQVDISNMKVTGGDYSPRDLEKAVNIESRNRAAVELYEKAFSGKLAVAFCVNIKHAEDVAAAFNARGIEAECVTQKTSRKETAEILERFHRGETKVLCTVDKLTEGFDEPRASVALNLRPTLSRIVAEQRGGRVLRLDELDQNKFAYVIDFLDKKTDTKKPSPVTFAEILEGTAIVEPRSGGGGERKPPGPGLPDIKIEGIEIVTDSEEIIRIAADAQGNRQDELEKAPKGWLNTTELSDMIFGADIFTIRKIVEKYRADYPEWFKNYKSRSGPHTEYFSPELVKKVIEEIESIGKAPEGWMTVGGLAQELSVTSPTIERRGETFRANHPEWFREFRIKIGTVHEHMDPELVKIIREEVESVPRAPDGWLTLGAIIREKLSGRRARETVLQIAESYRSEHPEWFKIFRSQSGLHEHYASELVEIIVTAFSKLEAPPEGWITPNRLAKRLRASDESFKRIAERYRKDHPDWFKVFHYKRGKPTEHIAPELAELIEKEYSSVDKTLPGWVTISQLSQEGLADDKTLRRLIEPYRSEHPEWFQRFKNSINSVREHIAPELISILREKIAKIPERPEGWLTIGGLATKLGVSHSVVAGIVEIQKKEHPEWAQEFRAPRKRVYEFLHPDLIALIEKELS